MGHRIVECPGCEAKLKVRESATEFRIDCPRCGERLVVAAVGAGTRQPPHSGTKPRPAQATRPDSSRTTASGGARTTKRPGTAAPSSARTSSAGGRLRRGTAAYDDASYDDFDEFESTYHNADKLPPRRSARSRTISDEDRRAQKENRVFLGILAVTAIAVVAGGIFVGQWLLSDGGAVEQTLADAPTENSSGSAAGTGFSSNADATNSATSTPSPDSASPFPAPAPNPVAVHPADIQAPLTPGPGQSGGGNGIAQTPPASAAPGNPVNVAADGRRLRYRWKAGDEHLYQINISAGSGDDVYRVSGSCSYQVQGAAGVTDDQESSGTGFVVAENGYIATCAHVVEGARQIEVNLLGQNYSATVVAVDAKSDVALIRIQASGLPVLPLKDSDAVQTAEYVRVVGFPLSDVLGTGVKVTTGTISGIVDDPQRGRRIQVDAPINPGNSGGPVVNEAAQVIGIASAKLAGSSVSSVGFVSPANQLKALMASQRIPASAAAAGATLAGPEIARRVTPAVAYIKVRGSSGGALTSVNYSASFTETQAFNPGRMRFGAFPTMPSHTSDRGKIRVNAMGEILEYSGEEHLPFVLGPVGLFFIERLSPYSESSWAHEEESTLTRIKRADRGPLGRGFGPPRGFGRPPGMGGPFGRDQPDEVIDTIPAVERISYQTDRELNGKIAIRKSYEFTTTRNPERPYMKIRGNGTVVFDTSTGMPHSLEYEATLESNDEDGNSRFPVKITYNLRNPEEVRREREAAQEKHKEMQEQKEREKSTPDPTLVETLLDEIRAAEGGIRASQPFGRLAELAVVDEKRQRVLTVARKHLKNSNGFVAKSAAEAFAHWATEKEFDDLVNIMKNKDGMMYTAHQKVVVTMSGFNDPRVYPILIEAMNHSFVTSAAKDSMIRIGTPMEDVILQQFPELTDGRVKRELLDVLKKIGTSRCESFLEKIAAGPDFSLRHNAQQALDAVRARD